jgi:hypothetical protein
MLPPQILRASGNAVARLVNPDALEIRLFVPRRHVRAIRTQSSEVTVKAPAVDGLLAAGDTVQVELPLGQPQRRLAVQRNALSIRADMLHVFRVSGDRRAERGEARAGLADGDRIGVEGKLAPDDEFVVRGGELLSGDEKLQVVGLFETNR